jgi:hypothetical protein
VEARLLGLETEQGYALIASLANHLDDEGWDPESPAFTLMFSDAALTALWVDDGGRRLDAAAIRMRHDDVSGGHRLQGVIAAIGPNILAGALTEPANQYQIAPTVLHLLGLPQDERMLAHAPSDGGVLLQLSTPAWLAANPIRGVPEYEGTDREALLDGRAAPPHPRQEEELESLRSLGYVR